MPLERIPLCQPITTRDGTLKKDSKSVNCYFDPNGQTKEFVKRPGLKLAADILGVVAPNVKQSQGLTEFNNQIIAAIDNTIYKIDPLSYAISIIGGVIGPVEQCYFVKDFLNANLVFHNGTNIYYYTQSSGTTTTITPTSVASVNVVNVGSGYTSSATVTFSAAPVGGTTATGVPVVSGGTIQSITITNPGAGYSTAPSVTINPVGGGSGATATALLNAVPTGPFVPGIVYLDTYIFVANAQNRIYNSNLGDPTTWQALDYISFEQSSDNIIGIAKHFNYLVAFGQWSMQFYYDAGTTTPGLGSPLQVIPSYMSEIGCANGSSIVSTEQTVIWIGTSKTQGRSVYMLNGTSPQLVSTPYIDKILGNSDMSEVTAYVYKVNGHTLYVLTLHDLNVTIVYDVNEQQWYQWTQWAAASEDQPNPGTYSESYFRPTFYADVNNTPYVLDDDRALLYILDDSTYNDNGAPIYCRSVTSIVDGGTTKRKFFQRLELVGDKVNAVMNIRHSGDDYKSYSSFRGVDLDKIRPQIYNSGQDRRRSWEFLCTDNVPIRLESAEIDFEIGEIQQ